MTSAHNLPVGPVNSRSSAGPRHSALAQQHLPTPGMQCKQGLLLLLSSAAPAQLIRAIS